MSADMRADRAFETKGKVVGSVEANKAIRTAQPLPTAVNEAHAQVRVAPKTLASLRTISM